MPKTVTQHKIVHEIIFVARDVSQSTFVGSQRTACTSTDYGTSRYETSSLSFVDTNKGKMP